MNEYSGLQRARRSKARGASVTPRGGISTRARDLEGRAGGVIVAQPV
jgi:hypothetical protein